MPPLKTTTACELSSKHPEYYLGSLKGTALFSNLHDSEILCFQKAAMSRSYKKGQTLFLEEEIATFFYVLCGGWIKLFHTTQEGEEIIVDMLTIGDIVGESAIFEHGVHTSSAQIIEDAHLLIIPTLLLKEQIGSNPKLAFSMLTSMSRHHRRHYGEIALNAMQNAPQRVGCFLLRLCPKNKEKDIILQLPYDKTLIAQLLGMKGATFSRALHILQKKTGVHVHGARVEIASIMRLAQLVYGPSAAKYISGQL